MPVVTRQVSSVRGTKSSRPVPPPVLGVIRVPEPVLTGLYCHNETPLLISIIHQIQLIRGITNEDVIRFGREVFKVTGMTVLMPIFSVLAVSRTPAPLKAISVISSLMPGLRAL
ncbi:hypothetical protein Asd1617_03843 [Shigella dysenteriae 1617]|uniref:Uncharacterized protein n=1 Tax=Shigella dysenteriae 1617 TaxID=754093 RepID=A0A0A6ZXL2_SHIDY|nr:hypothetical protein Asd1617_03843 [Shigella dysenteriae 1617]